MGKGYRHLCLDERIEIEKGLERGDSLHRIAARLGRAVSTISREAKHDWLPANQSCAYKPYKTTLWHGPWQVGVYRAGPAQKKADARAANSHGPRLFTDDRVVAYVKNGLRRGWSPAMIAGRGSRDNTIHICHESIYAWIYANQARAHDWCQYLTRGHKHRRRKHGRRVHASRIPFRVSIQQRPNLIDQRVEFGHWEGDTVLGAKTDRDGIHTEVERVTRYLMATKIPDLTSATTARTQLAMFTPLPPQAARSATLDNGTENHHSHILDLLAMPVWFADPYSSWQRGTNENLNGVLRRYLPKQTHLATLTDDELADIVTEINNRPLKCLNWETPAEAFQRLSLNQHQNVALQN
jgi:IS30 family transposase